MGPVSPLLPFEKHAACGVPRRVPSMARTCLMTGGPNKKKEIFRLLAVFIKAETQQAPEISNPQASLTFSTTSGPPPQCLFLSWPWYAYLKVGALLTA